VALTLATPWLLVLWPGATPLFHDVFAPWCHQLPERSLHFDEQSMIVCSRCVGIYSGIAAGVWWPKPLSTQHIRWGLIGTFVLIVTQVAAQELWMGVHHAPRLASGGAVGLAMGVMLASALTSLKSKPSTAGVE